LLPLAQQYLLVLEYPEYLVVPLDQVVLVFPFLVARGALVLQMLPMRLVDLVDLGDPEDILGTLLSVGNIGCNDTATTFIFCQE
jgi:hypothetical protein